jgi:hypothetical protein
MIKKGFCIRCGKDIPFNIDHPYCFICGGSCSHINRFSSSDGGEYYCHGCRDQAYISSENIFCDLCNKKYTSK